MFGFHSRRATMWGLYCFFTGLRIVQHRKSRHSLYPLLTCMLINYVEYTSWIKVRMNIMDSLLAAHDSVLHMLKWCLFLFITEQQKAARQKDFMLWFSSHCDRCESPHILWKQFQHLVSDLIYLVTLLMGQLGDSCNKQETWILSTSSKPSRQMELFVRCFYSLKHSVGNQDEGSWLFETLNIGPKWTTNFRKGHTPLQTHTGFEGSMTLEATDWKRQMYWKVAELQKDDGKGRFSSAQDIFRLKHYQREEI